MREWFKKRRVVYSIVLIALAASCTMAYFLVVEAGSSAEKKYRHALAALHAGDFRTVAATARRLESVPEFEDRARYLRAACLTKTGKGNQALAEIATAPQTGELLVPLLLLAAEAHYQEGRLAEAETAARRASQADPGNIDAHRWLASILYDLGANQAAAAELSTIMQLAPQDFSPHHMLATMESDAEQFQEAIPEYRAALERHPPGAIRPAIVRGLVSALVAYREYAGALEALADERRRHELPQDAVSLALEAECRWNLGEQDQARELLDQASLIDAHEPRLLLVRSRVLFESGQAAGAVPLLEELLEKDPHDFESRYRLALAFRRLNETGRADEEMQRVRQSQALRRRLTDLSDQAVLRPRDAQVRDELADVCERLAKPELARLYRQAANACRRSGK
ncbi:MAG TPA: tetratricopeptide repeat protein [Planctomycetaceae bacterium]